MTLAEYGDAGVGPVRGPRARLQGSPVAVTRSGPGSLDPPSPRGGSVGVSPSRRRLASRARRSNGDDGSP
jgi:hypothetical protein